MAEGILVTYATRHDPTRGIASDIADVLRDSGFSVLLEPISAVPSLLGIRGVVLGSPVWGGEWLPGIGEFIHDFGPGLARLPFWMYVAGLDEAIPAEAGTEVPTALIRRIEDVRPRDIALFAGTLQPHHLGAGLRVLGRLARMPAADHRDWQAIERWATAIGEAMATELGRTPAPKPEVLAGT